MQTPSRTQSIGIVLTLVLVAAGLAGLIYILNAPEQPAPEAVTVPYASTQALQFDHAPFQRVCRQYVNDVGLVDYAALKKNPEDLKAFLEQVERVSPHSSLATFPTAGAALAYWINAYNAHMLNAVIEAYPVDSVKNISEDPGVFDQKIRTCGGEELSLNDIEHRIVRSEFIDPRFHFALNCASLSCPYLPQEAFTPEKLNQQLRRETKRFLGVPSHLRVNPETKTVHLSQYFNWYGKDFTRWLRENRDMADADILDYVRMNGPESVVQKIGGDYEITFSEYDWRLNDQNADWASERLKDQADQIGAVVLQKPIPHH